jgi:hypothetical protein
VRGGFVRQTGKKPFYLPVGHLRSAFRFIEGTRGAVLSICYGEKLACAGQRAGLLAVRESGETR